MKRLIPLFFLPLLFACNDTEDVSAPGTVRLRIMGNDLFNDRFTRAVSLAESSLSDLWVFDYIDGEYSATYTRISTDDDFGSPLLPLSVGEHHLYVVASSGVEPIVDTDAHAISWSSVRDTFWGEVSVSVTGGSAMDASVTLSRAVTRLRLSVLDEVPDDIARVTVTLGEWSKTLDWLSGLSDDALSDTSLSVAVPSSYAGTTGSLVVSFWGMSDPVDWQTDVTISATDGSGSVIGGAQIAGVPFRANRASEYSGKLFRSDVSAGIYINNDWQESHTGTW